MLVFVENPKIKSTDFLKRQLEMTRFERALEVSESLAVRRALLTITELARLNQIVTGETETPWRQGSVSVELPSGKIESFTLIADPMQIARERLHRATARAESGSPVDAAVELYVDLVLAHVFKDGNRRTAVLSGHYFLTRYGVPLSGLAILELGLGNLREEGQIQALRELIHHMVKFARKTHDRLS